jgi:hypothetical protein
MEINCLLLGLEHTGINSTLGRMAFRKWMLPWTLLTSRRVHS